MTAKQGAGLNFTNLVNQNTNQLTGYCYDADGNMLGASCATPSYAYEVANRMVSAQTSSGGTEYYQYGADYKRIAKAAGTGEAIYMYGANGEKLWAGGFASGTNYVYFNGKLLGQNANPQGTYPYYTLPYVSVDRLGSVGSGYLPYGEQASPPASDDQVQFATYTRDANTGLDYADQRYYTSQFGRFMSADRYNSAVPGIPSSWNRYAYVLGDPANRFDPNGTESCNAGELDGGDDDGDCLDDGDDNDDTPTGGGGPTFSVTVTAPPLTWDIPIFIGTFGIGTILERLMGPLSIVIGVIISPTPAGGPDEDCYQQFVEEQELCYEYGLGRNCLTQAAQRYVAC